MTSPGRPVSHRARSDIKYLVEGTSIPQSTPRTIREGDQVSHSYPGASSMSTPIMGSPPSPLLQPERPPRSMSPDTWTLSSPNPSEMPSPLRKALVPMLSLAREAQEEAYADRGSPREVRSAPGAPADESWQNSPKARSSPASHPTARPSQGRRTYYSPRVETESDPEEGSTSRAWRTLAADRTEQPRDERRTPPPAPLSTANVRNHHLSPRRSTKSKAKRTTVARRRLIAASGLSSDGGLAGSPLLHSPLIALPLPDIPQSASSVERLFFPPERPVRSQQRVSASPIPSPSRSPLELPPVPSPPPRVESPQAMSMPSGEEDLRGRSPSPSPSRASNRDRASPAMSARGPLSPGSTLAQTRPPSPAEDPRASPKAAGKGHAGSSKQFMRSPSPVEEPAVRHSQFYMEDEMVILRVENCLFRVHRYFLERDSTFFKEFFQRELVLGAGKTDSTAIRLADVSRREFECLLHFLYHGGSSPQNDSILNLVLLLSTSSQLAFPAARTHAISALDAASPPLDPVERVFLAEKYTIPAWLRPAYVALCSRAHPLEDAEAEVLGLQTTARLARAREAVLEEKVQEWRRAVERVEQGQGVSKEDMEVREAKLVERVVDEIFAVDR